MRVLIIDDEKRARHLLHTLLEEHLNEVEVVGEATDLQDGLKLIESTTPDLIFLDIEMPGESGLEIIKYIKPDQHQFQIIFVTAYNQYAVEAFKTNAIDYLLKPIDIEELKTAFAKARKHHHSQQVTQQLEQLRRSVKHLSLDKIVMEVPRGYMFASHNDIIYFEADGMYTKVITTDGKTNLICKPLRHFVEQLATNDLFFKCHRSFLVNLKHITELVKHDGDYIVMENQRHIPISKSKRDQFLKVIEETFL